MINKDEYKVINENKPCDTKVEADDIVRCLNQKYNMSEYGLLTPQSEGKYPFKRTGFADFKITEEAGKFYIWIKIIELDRENNIPYNEVIKEGVLKC